jgi:hypothetical protein
MRIAGVLILLGQAWLLTAQPGGMFAPTGSMNTPRGGHTATLLANGKVLVAGGYSYGFPSQVTSSAELYDPVARTFEQTGSMNLPRAYHTATLLADGKVLIAGGNGGSQNLQSAELYDPSTGRFALTGVMALVEGWHAAILLGDGKVLMSGCTYPCNSAAAEIYDPETGRFAPGGSPGAGGDAAALLADGRVLITGGCPADLRGTKAQLFDPATGAFSYTGLGTNGCDEISTATLLTDGRVLLVGNDENDGVPADAEVYDSAAGAFTNLGHTARPHEFSAATLIPDGTVLITGGQLPGGSGDPGAELYLPAAGDFAPAGYMNQWRHSHTSTLLPDGTVLIAGGYSTWPGPANTSAEIFRPSVLEGTPVLLSLSGSQGAVLHAVTHQVVSADNPAIAGEALEIYATGLIDRSVIPPRVAIGGRMAEILWFGNAPGYAGLNQVNARVPDGLAAGPAVPMRLSYLGRSSNEVTIGLR